MNLVLHLPKPAAAKAEAAAGTQGDSVDALHEAGAADDARGHQRLAAGTRRRLRRRRPKRAGRRCACSPTTRRRFRCRIRLKMSNSTAPTARLSSPARRRQSVADFYRTAMKEQGWNSQSSVINNANMVVLNFAKAGKAVSFTIMRMGNKTKVSARRLGA